MHTLMPVSRGSLMGDRASMLGPGLNSGNCAPMPSCTGIPCRCTLHVLPCFVILLRGRAVALTTINALGFAELLQDTLEVQSQAAEATQIAAIDVIRLVRRTGRACKGRAID